MPVRISRRDVRRVNRDGRFPEGVVRLEHEEPGAAGQAEREGGSTRCGQCNIFFPFLSKTKVSLPLKIISHQSRSRVKPKLCLKLDAQNRKNNW